MMKTKGKRQPTKEAGRHKSYIPNINNCVECKLSKNKLKFRNSQNS